MANECPCGCGRTIAFTARCLAKRALYIDSLLPVSERMQALAQRDDERDSWTEFEHMGETYRDTLLAVVHDEEVGLANSPAEFAEFRKAADLWESRALSVSRRLRVEDERWHTRWGGPSYRRTPTATT
jgi:hypothetical protein